MVRRYLLLYLFLQGAQSSSFPADPSAAWSWRRVKTKRFQRSVFKMWLCRRCSRAARCNDGQWVNTAFFFMWSWQLGSLNPLLLPRKLPSMWVAAMMRAVWSLYMLNAASCLISFSAGYTVPPFMKGKEWQQYLKWISWLTTSETSTVTYSCSLLQEQLDSLCKSVRLIKFFIECLDKKKSVQCFFTLLTLIGPLIVTG